MYVPDPFDVADESRARAFIAAQAFGQLVSEVEGQSFATPLPLMFDACGRRMLGHLARQNPQWRALENQSVLVIVQGPHGYVSPRWYQGEGVPTWNYQVAHVRGRARVFHDRDRLAELVATLTHQHEAGVPGEPWVADYPAGMLSAIVGVSIDIEAIQCKFKLSQNRPVTDRVEVSHQLEQLGSVSLARAMRDEDPQQESPE